MYGFSFSEQCILMEDDADRSNVGAYNTCGSDNGQANHGIVVDTTDVYLTESMLEDADIFSGQATVNTSINQGKKSFAVVNTSCFAESVLNTVGISFNVAFTVNDNGAVVRRGWCNGWSSPVRIGQKLTGGRRFLYGSQKRLFSWHCCRCWCSRIGVDSIKELIAVSLLIAASKIVDIGASLSWWAS
jgi:hypothetical protein